MNNSQQRSKTPVVSRCGGAGVNEAIWSEIARLTRVAREGSRGYADYWDWRLDRARAEEDAARVLWNFLERSGERSSQSVSRVTQDPPDVLLTTIDGRRLGIEITELVDSDAAKRHRERKKHDLGTVDAWVEWTPVSVAKELERLVGIKDGKLAKATGCYDELLLAIVTDEPMIDDVCARQAVALCHPVVSTIERSFLIMSYHPNTDQAVYPDRCLVLPIQLSQSTPED